MKNRGITVIIVTYNPDFEKIKRTINSIINQKGVDIELIVSDDGSKCSLKKETCIYLEDISFSNYKFLESNQNQGTVLNTKKALDSASYNWIKCISPGDMLYDDYTLMNWLTFMENNNAKVSFGRSVVYNKKGVLKRIVEYPINKECFLSDSYNKREAYLDYLYLKDVPNGASFLCDKTIYLKYINLVSNKIKYAEDMIFRIMLTENISIKYFYNPVIWYEYGEGISTSGNEKWVSIIDNERIISNKIIVERSISHGYLRKIEVFVLKILGTKYESLKYFFIPRLLYLKLRKNTHKSFSLSGSFFDISLKKILEND